VNGGTAIYEWKLNGSPVGTNATTYSSTTLIDGDVVGVTMTSNAVCATNTTAISNNLSTIVNTVPDVPGSISGNSSVCFGALAQIYSVTATPGLLYHWAFTGGGGLINETSNVLSKDFLSKSSGFLNVSAENSCGKSSISQLNVSVIDKPAQPSYFTDSAAMVQQGETGVLYSVSNISEVNYIWTFSGGSTTITTNGKNSVMIDYASDALSGNLSVTANNTCGASSARTMFVIVNTLSTTVHPIIEAQLNKFDVFPNPINSTDALTITTPMLSNVKISLSDLQGNEIHVLAQQANWSAGAHTFIFPEHLKAGLYFVNIESTNSVKSIKVALID
jgi:hypothetical protein